MSNKDTTIKLIGRGKNGWHYSGTWKLGDSVNSCSGSGGTIEGYAADAPEGTPVYDADKADFGTFAKLVCSGPMVSTTLAPGEVQKFGDSDRKAMLGMLPGLGGDFKTLAIATMVGLTSLDYVAVDVYLALLRESVPGVKYGTVQGGKVVWE